MAYIHLEGTKDIVHCRPVHRRARQVATVHRKPKHGQSLLNGKNLF